MPLALGRRTPLVSLAFASLIGCSGAKLQFVEEAPSPGATTAGDDAGGASPSAGDDAGATGSSGGGGSTNGSGAGNGGSGTGSGSGSGTGAGNGGGGSGNGSGSGNGNGNGGNGSSGGGGVVGTPAPTTCPAGAVVETGGNDKRFEALAFTQEGCGSVSPIGDDWWTFTLPQSVTSFAFQYSGKVAITVSLGGDTVSVGFGSSGNAIPFQPGGTYFVQVTSATNDVEPYVLDVQEQ